MNDYNVERFEQIVRTVCTMTTDDLFEYLAEFGFILTNHGSELYGKNGSVIYDRYAYRPGTNADSPLLVCHADTVRRCLAYEYDADRSVVTSSELDDRLGIACMLYVIELGSGLSNCAMLVCDNEEIAASTATTFTDDVLASLGLSSAGYPNWLMEFDRHGTDVVCYDYENDTFSSLLEHAGFEIGVGSFSDISSMTELGRSGVNVGVGYHREHTLQCYADLTDTLKQLGRAEVFYSLFGHIALRYTPPKRYGRYSSDRLSYDRYLDDDWNDISVKTTGKLTLSPVPSLDMWDNPIDENGDMIDVEDYVDGTEILNCECCDVPNHLDDLIDWHGSVICDQCYADYILKGTK